MHSLNGFEAGIPEAITGLARLCFLDIQTDSWQYAAPRALQTQHLSSLARLKQLDLVWAAHDCLGTIANISTLQHRVLLVQESEIESESEDDDDDFRDCILTIPNSLTRLCNLRSLQLIHMRLVGRIGAVSALWALKDLSCDATELPPTLTATAL